MPKIATFNGGIRTATAPHLIQPHEAVTSNNVNHIPGTLSPIPALLAEVTGARRYGHLFSTDKTWYWSFTPKDYVEYQENLYIGNRDGPSTKIYKGVEFLLGIAGPTAKPLVDVTLEAAGLIDELSLDTGAAMGDLPKGESFVYRVINDSIIGNITETQAEFRTDPEKYDNRFVRIRINDRDLDYKAHVYRKYKGTFKKVGDVTPIVGVEIIDDVTYNIANNENISVMRANKQFKVPGPIVQYAMTYVNTRDGTESVPVLSKQYAIDNGTAVITNLEVSGDPQVNLKRLYRIGGNITVFTLVAELGPDVTTYTDDVRDSLLPGDLLDSGNNYPPPATGISHMIEAYAMLFALDGDKLIFTEIGEPDYWPITNFLDFPRRLTGLAKTPIGLLVFDKFETWLVTGTGPTSLSQQSLTASQGCVNGDSVVNVQGAAYWASTDGICISNGGQVKVYTREKLGKVNFSASTNAVVYDDEYYIHLRTGFVVILDIPREVIRTAFYDTKTLFLGDDSIYGYADNILFNLKTSAEVLSMHYVSPEFVGAGLTIQKAYKNIYMNSSGQIDIQVLIDGVVAGSDSFTDRDNHQIKIESESTRGFYIQFIISGLGTVYELDWEDGNVNA